MTETVVAVLGVLAVVIAFLIVPALIGVDRSDRADRLSRGCRLWCGRRCCSSQPQVCWSCNTAGGAHGPRAPVCRGAGRRAMRVSFCRGRRRVRLEQLLTASAGDERGIAIAFAPGDGTISTRRRPGSGRRAGEAGVRRGRCRRGKSAAARRGRAHGVPSGARVRLGRGFEAARRSLGRDADQSRRPTRVSRARATTSSFGRPARTLIVHQGIRVPGAMYNRVKAEPIDVQLDYSFTLFRDAASYALPARDGDQRMPGIGWCATRVNDAGTRVCCSLSSARRAAVVPRPWCSSTRRRDNEILKSRCVRRTTRRIPATRAAGRAQSIRRHACRSTIPPE